MATKSQKLEDQGKPHIAHLEDMSANSKLELNFGSCHRSAIRHERQK